MSTVRSAAPSHVIDLVTRVLTSPSARSSPELRRAIFAHVAALTCHDPEPPELPAALVPYVRKVAFTPYKVLDREVEAIRAAGYDVAEVFELTVAASVAAGFARMDIALAALEESR